MGFLIYASKMNSRSSGFSQLGLTPPFLSSPARKAKQDANDILSPVQSGTGSRPAPAGAWTSRGTGKIQRAWIRAFTAPQPIVSWGALRDMHRRGLSPPHASSLCTALDYTKAQKLPWNLVTRHKQKSLIKITMSVKSLLQS